MSPYYHVVVKNNEGNRQVIYRDLTESELKKKFIKPFKKGKNLFIDGSIFKVQNFDKVQVIKTSETVKNELKEISEIQNKARMKINQKPGPKFMFYIARDSDVVSCGQDVTSVYIRTAPKIYESNFDKFLKNPWIVGIGVIIIASFILWFISNVTGWAL